LCFAGTYDDSEYYEGEYYDEEEYPTLVGQITPQKIKVKI
jgi:hypothetical protein